MDKDKNYFRKLLKKNMLPNISGLNDSQKTLLGEDIKHYAILAFPKRFYIEQRSTSKICKWHSEKYRSNAHMGGAIPYILTTDRGGILSRDVPSDFQKVTIEELERAIDLGIV